MLESSKFINKAEKFSNIGCFCGLLSCLATKFINSDSRQGYILKVNLLSCVVIHMNTFDMSRKAGSWCYGTDQEENLLIDIW